MRSRGWLRSLAFIGVSAVLAAGCTGGAGVDGKAGGYSKPIVLRWASLGAVPGFQPPVEYFTQRVNELSGGDLRIDVVYGWGNFSPDAERQSILDVAAGKADLTSAAPRVFDTLGVQSFQALTAPMLIESYRLQDRVIRSDIPREMLDSLPELGVTGLGVLAGSLNKPIAVERPLLGPPDWGGITFETYRSQAQSEAIQALGAQSTNVIGAALNEGLKSGQDPGLLEEPPHVRDQWNGEARPVCDGERQPVAGDGRPPREPDQPRPAHRPTARLALPGGSGRQRTLDQHGRRRRDDRHEGMQGWCSLRGCL